MRNKLRWILIFLLLPLLLIGYQNCSSGFESVATAGKVEMDSILGSDLRSGINEPLMPPDFDAEPDQPIQQLKLLNCNTSLRGDSAEFSWQDSGQTDSTIYDFLLGSSENERDIYDHVGKDQFNKTTLVVDDLPKDGRKIYQTLIVFRDGAASEPIKVRCVVTAFTEVIEGEPTNDDRSAFWKNKGYSLYWESTPELKHLGKSHENYFRKEWSNGHKIPSYGIDAGYPDTLTIARAPDNSISAKVRIRKSEEKGVNIKGMQFGEEGPEKTTLWSLKWYNPCNGGQMQNKKSGTYVGFGHIWGAIKGSTRSPGGSRSELGAWSIRVPLAKNNTFFAYAYIPDRPKASGQSWSSNITPVCDKWMLTELEIILNKPASSKNGVLRFYIDKVLAREIKGIRIRDFDTVKPRGFGFFVRHNSGAPEDETFYFKDWKIYTK